jgi:hypothetical protein
VQAEQAPEETEALVVISAAAVVLAGILVMVALAQTELLDRVL